MDKKYISTKAVVDIGKEVAGVDRIAIDAKEIMRVRVEEYAAEQWRLAALNAKNAKPSRHTVMVNDIV